jgi:hypothetical protein
VVFHQYLPLSAPRRGIAVRNYGGFSPIPTLVSP